MEDCKNTPEKEETKAKINLSQPLNYLHYYQKHDFNSFNNMSKMQVDKKVLHVKPGHYKIGKKRFSQVPQNRLQKIERMLAIKNMYKKFSNSSENEFSVDSFFYRWLKIKNIYDRIIFLLKNLLRNKGKKKILKVSLYLLKWRQISIDEKYNRAAKKIQLAFFNYKIKSKNNNFKNSIVEKNKNIHTFINKIFLILSDIFRKLRQENSRRKLIKFFTFLKNRILSGPAYYGFRKLKKFYKTKLLTIKKNAVKIQKNYKAHMQRNKFKTFINNSNFSKTIKKYIQKLSDTKVYLRFLNWSKICNSIKQHENTKIIQIYLRKVFNLKKCLRAYKSIRNLKNIFSDYRIINFSKFKNNLIQTLKFIIADKKLLKTIFLRINIKLLSFICNKNLNVLCRKLKNIQTNRNKNSFDLIKKYYLNKKQNISAGTIQNYLLRKINNIKTNAKKTNLKSIIHNKNTKESFNKKYYLKKWNKISKNINMNFSGMIIKNFIRKKMISLNNRNNWSKILNFSNRKLLKENLLTIRILFFQKKYSDVINKHFKRSCTDKFKLKIKKYKFYKSLQNYIVKKYQLDKNIILENYFVKLKKANNFYKERENCTKNLINILKTYQKTLFPRNYLVFPIKLLSLKYFLKRILQRSALKKISTKVDNRTKLSSFATQLANFCHSLKKNSILQLRNNIYLIYKLKILKDIEVKINCKIKDSNKEPFFKKVLQKITKESEFTYRSQIRRQVIVKPYYLTYVAYSKNHNKNKINNTSSNNKQHCSIYMHNFLSNLFRIKKKIAFDDIKNISRNRKLTSSLNLMCTKSSGPFFLSKLKINSIACKDLESNYSKYRRNISSMTFKLLKNKMKEISRMIRLFYLLRLIKLQKEISKNRFLSPIIKKWLFDVRVKKISKQKMIKLYESYHLTFLNMANEVYNQDYGQIYDLISNNINENSKPDKKY
jgi:hypothetical protein